MNKFKLDLIDYGGFGAAVTGMRLSHQSESDGCDDKLGDDDIRLMQKLISLGASHRKFMRTIQTWLLIYAPTDWWSQFDTYKVGITRLSASTMHSLRKWVNDGELHKHLPDYISGSVIDEIEEDVENGVPISVLKKKLPIGFHLESVVNLNYENILTICRQRAHHKLDEWSEFVKQVSIVPFYNDLILPFIKTKGE